MKKCVIITLKVMLFLAPIAVFYFILLETGVYVPERAEFVSLQYVKWNGVEYSPIYGPHTEGKTIAKGTEGDYRIISVKEDPSHTFIVARSFLDDCLLVSDDYAVPTSGKLTSVAWNSRYITDKAFLLVLEKIVAERETSFIHETEAIFIYNDNQKMKSLYFAYEDCPVATNYKGYLGKINGEWVITTYITEDRAERGAPQISYVGCYIIPSEYHEILSKYLYCIS